MIRIVGGTTFVGAFIYFTWPLTFKIAKWTAIGAGAFYGLFKFRGFYRRRKYRTFVEGTLPELINYREKIEELTQQIPHISSDPKEAKFMKVKKMGDLFRLQYSAPVKFYYAGQLRLIGKCIVTGSMQGKDGPVVIDSIFLNYLIPPVDVDKGTKLAMLYLNPETQTVIDTEFQEIHDEELVDDAQVIDAETVESETKNK